MIHLMTAKKIKPQARILFMIGSIAPDAVSDWQKKEITHYRTALNREKNIESIANNSDSSDDFAQGMILHLFTDWRWDALVIKAFIDNFGEGWFPRYRKELNLAGSYAFHTNNWSTDLWNRMEMQGENSYGFIDGATNEDLKNLITRNHKWHKENNIGPSCIITPEFIEKFIRIVIKDFEKFMAKYSDDHIAVNFKEISGQIINEKRNDVNDNPKDYINNDEYDNLSHLMIFKEKSCGAIICRKNMSDIDFLVLFQKKSQTWSFPKGHMNINETEKETALREIKEETGLEAVLETNFRKSLTYQISNGRDKEVVLFLTFADQNFELPYDEIEKCVWADKEMAKKLLSRSDYEQILDDAYQEAEKFFQNNT